MKIELLVKSTEEEIRVDTRWDDADILQMPNGVYSLGAAQAEHMHNENPFLDAGFSESGYTDIADIGTLSITATLAKLGWQLSQRNDGKYFLYILAEDDDEPIDGVSVIRFEGKEYNVTAAFETPDAAYKLLQDNLDIDDDDTVYVLDKAIVFAKDGREGLALECEPEDADKAFELPEDMATIFKEHFDKKKRDFIVQRLVSGEPEGEWLFVDGNLIHNHAGNMNVYQDALEAEAFAFLTESDFQVVYDAAYESVKSFIDASVKEYDAWASGDVYEVGAEKLDLDTEEFEIVDSATIYGWHTTDAERDQFAIGIIASFIKEHKFILIQKDNPILISSAEALGVSLVDVLKNYDPRAVVLDSGDIVLCLNDEDSLNKVISDFSLPENSSAQHLLGADYINGCISTDGIVVESNEYTSHYVRKYTNHMKEMEVESNLAAIPQSDMTTQLSM